LFLPAWNEASSLPEVVARADDHLAHRRAPYSVIVVDDGSTDATPVTVGSLAHARSNVIGVHHETNRGYGAALRTGFAVGLSTGHEWIAFCDADGQFDPSDVDLLVGAAREQGADMAIGYRRQRADPVARRILGRGWGLVSRVTLGVDARDIDCGFKAIHRSALARIAPLLTSDHAAISPELLLRARDLDLHVVEVGVDHAPRRDGAQSGANPRVIAGSLRSLHAVRQEIG
jgi:glycosyltransferase involved in cell wall biosynthesis